MTLRKLVTTEYLKGSGALMAGSEWDLGGTEDWTGGSVSGCDILCLTRRMMTLSRDHDLGWGQSR